MEETESANELGGNDIFWKYADLIYKLTNSNGGRLPVTSIVPVAKETILGTKKFTQYLES